VRSRLARSILGVLLESDRPMSRTRLMKTAFLVRQEAPVMPRGQSYDFLPYKYGPYSFMLDRDLRRLQQEGMIVGQRLAIAPEMKAGALVSYGTLTAAARGCIRRVVESYADLTDRELVDSVYERYPYYAHRSARTASRTKIRDTEPAAYTIGYEGVSVDAFLDALIREGIRRVIDVRHNPVSRRYGFSKNNFRRLLEKVGVCYTHIGELGIPSNVRREMAGRPRRELLDYYETEMLPNVPTRVAEAAKLMKQSPSVLVCHERDRRECHRGRLADWIGRHASLPVQHLEVSDVRDQEGPHHCQNLSLAV
jgi:uncharacterized protein (DUF488 family)